MNDLLIYLIFAIVFFLFDLIGKRRKKAAQQRYEEQQSLPGETPVRNDDPDLEEALRQIGEALGMPSPEKKPQPPALPEAKPVETDFHGQVVVQKERQPVKSRQPDFHEQSFEDRPPYKNRPAPREEAFEKRPPFQNRPAPREEAFEKLTTEPFSKTEQAFEDRPLYSEQRNLPILAPPKPLPAQQPLTLLSPLLTKTPKTTTPSSGTPDIQQLLKDPKRAREAFVLSEVFGPPKSLRK